MNENTMHLDDLKEIIKYGENSSVEFKNSSVRKESIAKEIIAFSNSSGGVILLGIDDDGTPSGLDNDFSYEEWVMNIARDSVTPSVNPDFFYMELSGKKVGIIDIPKGNNKPYQTIDNKYLVRVGSTNRVASQSELMRLFQQSGVFHYDLVGVDNTSVNSLNSGNLTDYFSKYSIDYVEESDDDRVSLLKNTDILTEDGRCTVGGLLLFGIKPQKSLFNASISIAKFRGNSINEELINKQTVEGTLPFQVDSATAIINNQIPTPSTIIGNKRVDTKAFYTPRTIREILVNAVVHRNYSISGSRIRVLIFDNRIEVISPGRLPNTISVEKIRYGVSYAVNPVLVKFMENMRYIDKLGRGIPMVCAEAKKINKEVQFIELGEDFKVILHL